MAAARRVAGHRCAVNAAADHGDIIDVICHDVVPYPERQVDNSCRTLNGGLIETRDLADALPVRYRITTL